MIERQPHLNIPITEPPLASFDAVAVVDPV